MTLPAVASAPGVRSTNGFTAGTGGAPLHGAVGADELHQPLGPDARADPKKSAQHVPAHPTDHQRQRQARPGQRAAARSRRVWPGSKPTLASTLERQDRQAPVVNGRKVAAVTAM